MATKGDAGKNPAIRPGWWKSLLWLPAAGVLFTVAVVFETYIRSSQKEPIPIQRFGAVELRIEAGRMPDFLGAGSSWWIQYESDVSFCVEFDAGSPARLPAGIHRIFYNHDSSNLDQQGLNFS